MQDETRIAIEQLHARERDTKLTHTRLILEEMKSAKATKNNSVKNSKIEWMKTIGLDRTDSPIIQVM